MHTYVHVVCLPSSAPFSATLGKHIFRRLSAAVIVVMVLKCISCFIEWKLVILSACQSYLYNHRCLFRKTRIFLMLKTVILYCYI